MSRDPTTKCSPGMRQLFIVGGSLLELLGQGCVLGFPAIMLSVPPPALLQGTDIEVTAESLSWIVSVVGFAILFGTLISPFIMKQYGRKVCHQILLLPALLGWITLAVSQNVTTIIIARIMQGFSTGLKTSLGPLIIAECTSPKSRGAFLGSISLALAFGKFLVHFVGTYIHWRTTAWICSSTSISAFIIITLSPETPNWLATQGRFDDARDAFYWLRGRTESTKNEIELLISSKIEEHKIRHSRYSSRVKRSLFQIIKEFLLLFKTRSVYISTFIVFNLFIMFQFSGNTVLASYTVQIMKVTMTKSTDPYTSMIVIDIVRLMSSLLSVLFIRKLRRRVVLFTSGLFTSLFLSLIALYSYLKSIEYITISHDWIAITLIILYVISMTLGVVSLPWTIAGEVFPLSHKELGAGIAGVFVSVVVFAALKTAPAMMENLHLHGTFGCYALIITICLANLYFVLPETKGKTLLAIDEQLKSSNEKLKYVEECKKNIISDKTSNLLI